MSRFRRTLAWSDRPEREIYADGTNGRNGVDRLITLLQGCGEPHARQPVPLLPIVF